MHTTLLLLCVFTKVNEGFYQNVFRRVRTANINKVQDIERYLKSVAQYALRNPNREIEIQLEISQPSTIIPRLHHRKPLKYIRSRDAGNMRQGAEDKNDVTTTSTNLSSSTTSSTTLAPAIPTAAATTTTNLPQSPAAAPKVQDPNNNVIHASDLKKFLGELEAVLQKLINDCKGSNNENIHIGDNQGVDVNKIVQLITKGTQVFGAQKPVEDDLKWYKVKIPPTFRQ